MAGSSLSSGSNVRVRAFDLRSKVLPMVGLALLLGWPALTGKIGFLSPSATYVDLGTSTLVVVILVYSLNLAMGYSGLLSLMHSGFLGLGGYVAGYFASRQGWSIWACIALALLLGALVGALSAAVSLRATYLYFGIITRSFAPTSSSSWPRSPLRWALNQGRPASFSPIHFLA